MIQLKLWVGVRIMYSMIFCGESWNWRRAKVHHACGRWESSRSGFICRLGRRIFVEFGFLESGFVG